MGKPIGDTRGESLRFCGIALSSRSHRLRRATQDTAEFDLEFIRKKIRRPGARDHHEVALPRHLVAVAPKPLSNAALHTNSHDGVPHSAANGDPESGTPVEGALSLLGEQQDE